MLLQPLLFIFVMGLPDWLAVLTRLNPLTYVVQPMRYLVLEHLSLSDAERERLLPVIT
jgi:ABC-2 type transport system permease protein